MNGGSLHSVAKALTLIEVLASGELVPRGVADLAREAGLTKSTAHRLLNTFYQLHLVERWHGKYNLSVRLPGLGELARMRMPMHFRVHLQPWLQELQARTGCVTRAAVLSGIFEVSIGIACDHDTIDVARLVDGPRHAADTAAGKVILAHSPAHVLERVVGDFGSFPGGSPEEAVALYRDLDRIRRTGWVALSEHADRRLTSVAAPIVNRRGEAMAALVVTGCFSCSAGPRTDVTPITVAIAQAASREIQAVSREAAWERPNGTQHDVELMLSRPRARPSSSNSGTGS
jgi:DNA-binding IclR family transcriptional regulator